MDYDFISFKNTEAHINEPELKSQSKQDLAQSV